ncbi:MAG: dTDP-glucose 4,6-dehydratase 2 [Parcubacteria group bacterium ADurb.Bin316]|nr:MAG: dTDP-glucose 4,6-dehydratase 2 [Parcubacteria group bacterium ADurb.Bin316]HOZ55868.1 dTDP-glucose 4,6-dehydratase [bacterium]
MSKILVTGGAGFIGSNFIHYWLDKYPEDKIANLDVLTYAGNLANLKDVADNSNYEFVKGDICDVDLVNKLVKKVDLVVHFAAETHVDRSIANSLDFIRTNVEGTRNLLEAAKNNGGVRFHHISTDEVFGALGPSDPKFNELTPYDPRSPYSASKAASDHLVRAYWHTHKLPITISNCTNNYGPYQYPEKIIPLFVTNLLDGKKVPMYAEGKNVRDWIYVDDHNRGVDVIIKKGKIGETYCLGANNELSNFELTKKILASMNISEEMIEYVADRPGHDFRYAMDASKIHSELGWAPEINFEQGLAETIKWYQENEEWWRALKR